MSCKAFRLNNDSIEIVAQSICKFISSIDEIKLGSLKENSLFSKVCNDIKNLRCSHANRLALKRLYEHDEELLKIRIQELLVLKNNNVEILELASSQIYNEINPNPSTTVNTSDEHFEPIKIDENIEVVFDIASQPQSSNNYQLQNEQANDIADGKKIQILHMEILKNPLSVTEVATEELNPDLNQEQINSIDDLNEHALHDLELLFNEPEENHVEGFTDLNLDLNQHVVETFFDSHQQNAQINLDASDSEDEFEPILKKNNNKNAQEKNNNILIKFTKDEWDEFIFDENTGTLKSKSYMNKIRDKFVEHFSCIVNSKNSKITANSIIIYTYKCKQEKCQRIYKFTHHKNSNNNKDFIVTFKGEQHHSELLTPQLRGDKRIILKNKLKNNYATDIQTELAKEISMDLKNEGNLQNYKGLSVLNVARSEALASSDLDKDDIIDIFKMTSNNDRLHRLMVSPFCIYISSKKQIDIFQKFLKNNNEICLHIDATGSLVRHPGLHSILSSENNKPIYYYAMVMNLKLNDGSGLNYPLCEMITDCHTSINIEIWIQFFQNEASKSSNVFFQNVVTDFSKANINAICSALNKLTPIVYINNIYDNISNLSNVERFAFIHLCYAHLKKNFERFALKYFDKKPYVVKNLLIIFDCIIHELEYEKTKEKIIDFMNLCTEVDSEASNVYLKRLLSKEYEVFQIPENDSLESETIIIDDQFSEDKAFYEKNKFYKEFQQIYTNIIVLSAEYGCNNDYFNPKFIEKFLKQFIPYIALWSKAIYKMYNASYTGSNFTNASVESYFGELKNNVHKNSVRIGRAPLKVGRFCNLTMDLVDNKSFVLENNIPRTSFTNRKSNKRKGDPNILEEYWNKSKRRPAMKHFSKARKQILK